MQVLFIAWAIYSPAKEGWQNQHQYGEKAPRPILYGIWKVEEFRRNGQTIPPLLTDASRWRRIVITSARS